MDTHIHTHRRMSEWMNPRGSWLTQSVEDATLDLRVVTSSPLLDVEITKNLKKNFKKDNTRISPVASSTCLNDR